MSYKEDTQIDESNLEGEWIKQANTYAEYVDQANVYAKQLTELKNRLKVVKASTEMGVRTGKLDIGCKITDKAIAAFVDINPEVVELEKEIAEAKYKYDMYNGGVFALEQKKRALENLVKLGMNNFNYSTTSYDDYRNKIVNEQ